MSEPKDWLAIAREAYQSSTDYLDANFRQQWEANVAMFQSRHPNDSKYSSEAYKHRSRIFRPKTRSAVRKNEAAAAAAFFSNPDVVSIAAENEGDPMQQASAELWSQVLNYRLQKTVPWFKVLVGAIQDAQVYGIVCSYQYWRFEERIGQNMVPYADDYGPLMGPDGAPVMIPQEYREVVKDEPCIELLPPENIRFDPGADWQDVIRSSPYVIRLVPMYVGDVKAMMQQSDSKTGRAKWLTLSDGQIKQAQIDNDTLRQARENPREDPKAENDAPLGDFEIVWVHENFVRLDGEELVYWTMGTQHLLSEPKPLADAYHHGERPFVIGTCVLEAHRAVPDAYVKLGEQLQRESNDVVNQRMDNVKLVLNKRWIVKRGKNVDVPSLLKNVAGSVTLADDVDGDVRELNWPDVTSSAYQEQDRLNVDFDELMGNFSTSSVATNRSLNETVGGMNLLQGGASQLTEYLLRTFTETWVEPVLRQLVKLEQMYESDLTILGLAGERAKLNQKYGIDQITDQLLNQELTVRVNVGMGATNPQQKLQQFTHAAMAYSQISQALPNADLEAVRKEIFGLAGYRDGSRFFPREDDPNTAKLQQAEQFIQQMGQQMQAMQGELQQMKQDKGAQMLDQLAAADLKQAQTVKTLTEAAYIPSQALAQQATEPAGG